MSDTLHIFFTIIWPYCANVLQIALLSAVFYFILRSLRNTAGIFVFSSFIVILGGLSLLAHFTGMRVLATLSNRILTQLPLVAIVIFQQDLRRILTLLSNRRSLNIRKNRLISQAHRADMLRELIQRLTQAVCSMTTLPEWRAYLSEDLSHASVARLASTNTGALIAIEGRQGLDEYIERGVKLDCEVERLLLETIFYKGSPLHDGGIIIRGGRIVAASCQFPMAAAELYEAAHTRHSAAVGLSGQSDALVIVISEESGRVSVAQGGAIERINTPRGLIKALESRYGLSETAKAPEEQKSSWLGGLLKALTLRRGKASADEGRKK